MQFDYFDEIDLRTRNEQPSSLNFCLKIVCIVYWSHLTEMAEKGRNLNFQSYFWTANLFSERQNGPGKIKMLLDKINVSCSVGVNVCDFNNAWPFIYIISLQNWLV